MTIKEALIKYKNVEVELLLAFVLKKPKEFVFMNQQIGLSAGQQVSLSALAKRRMRGEPIAYILGYKDFYGLRFKVNKDVLIPRPETEWVVEHVIGVIPNVVRNPLGSNSSKIKGFHDSAALARNDTLKILDIGTGSGAIITSLAHTMGIIVTHNGSHCEFYASDISQKALAVAKQNAKIHKAKVKFIKSNLLKNIKFEPDIIIANLPYLPKYQQELRYEPKQALYAKEKGLELIHKLLQQVASRKRQPKLIYLEFDPRQKSDLQKIIKKILPQAEIKFYKDFNNLWRYVEIKI